MTDEQKQNDNSSFTRPGLVECTDGVQLRERWYDEDAITIQGGLDPKQLEKAWLLCAEIRGIGSWIQSELGQALVEQGQVKVVLRQVRDERGELMADAIAASPIPPSVLAAGRGRPDRIWSLTAEVAYTHARIGRLHMRFVAMAPTWDDWSADELALLLAEVAFESTPQIAKMFAGVWAECRDEIEAGCVFNAALVTGACDRIHEFRDPLAFGRAVKRYAQNVN